LSLFNAHQDERCFAPIHVYYARTGYCAVTVLRPGKAPGGKEVRAHLLRLVRRMRMNWPKTPILIRGDSHYGRAEAMEWCENNDVRYIFGFGPNKVLAEQVFPELDACCVRRALGQLARCGRSPWRATPRNPGPAPAGWWHGSRRRRKAPVPRRLSPTSSTAARSTYTKRPAARAARRRTLSSGTRASLRPTGRVAARRSPTRCG
jgi:hypothetical protein